MLLTQSCKSQSPDGLFEKVRAPAFFRWVLPVRQQWIAVMLRCCGEQMCSLTSCTVMVAMQAAPLLITEMAE